MSDKYKQFREVMSITTHLVLAEKEAELADLTRIENIISEAIGQLRDSFTEFNELLTEMDASLSVEEAIAGSEVDGTKHAAWVQAQNAYRKSITALQFEDIVQQIIGYAKLRGQEIDRILRRVEDGVRQLESEDMNERQLQQLLEVIRHDLVNFRSVMSSSSPVVQQGMNAGEMELF